jgi:hypothetical protein
MRNKTFSPTKKDRNKRIRVIFQVIILLAFAFLLVKAVFFSARYKVPGWDKSRPSGPGFIALSYYGVDRGDANESLISTVRLEEHLQALRDLGYMTVSQADILAYYQDGKPLPERALFLLFEDGRRDTAIFTQPLLEKFNFKATALSYADNLIKDDPKFLRARDLNKMQGSTFWELGSNGCQLAYINVFDRYGNFLDVMDSLRFQGMSSWLDRHYDHYLMDFIRDEQGIPKETPGEMRERISGDYEKLRDVYTSELGGVPGLYSIMHSNTDWFGTNPRAGEVNAEWIYTLFSLHFNREGNCLNTPQNSVYDLTRTQPAPYWYTNHLLTRIQADTGQGLEFVIGDARRAGDWDILNGAAEFKDENIVLTTVPGGTGLMCWKAGALEDLGFSAILNGNKAGGQSVYLRADKGLNRYIALRLLDNVLYIVEKSEEGPETTLFTLDLATFDGTYIQSMEENRREAKARKLELDARYADTARQARDSLAEMSEVNSQPALTVAEGAAEYRPPIRLGEFGRREIEITLSGNTTTVLVDGRLAVQNLPVAVSGGGDVLLESAVSGSRYSERNLTDNIYDGVFTDAVVCGSRDGEILYDNRLRGIQRAAAAVKAGWNSVVDWFIRTL